MLALQSRTDKRLDAFERRMDAFVVKFERLARLEGLIKGSGLLVPAKPSEAAGG